MNGVPGALQSRDPACSAEQVESHPSREKRQPALEKSRLPEYNMTEQQSGRRGGRRLER